MKDVSHLVHNANKAYTITRFIRQKTVFTHFPLARNVTDATFEECNNPIGNPQEVMKYFSRKLKLYRYNLEVSVMPNGFTILCGTHYVESVADVVILYKRKRFHSSTPQQLDDEVELANFGPLEGLHPKKKACDRIIVVKFFGRMDVLWNTMSNKYRSSEETYDTIPAICVSVNNAHIINYPLRASDREMYQWMKNRTYQIGNDRIEKRRRAQRTDQEKRKQRVAISFGATFVYDESNMI